MTRQEIIAYCFTFLYDYEYYLFDEIVDDNATTVMRHKANKKSFALIMRHKGDLYLNLKCDALECSGSASLSGYGSHSMTAGRA